jgi:hypothetical protein
MKIFKLKSIAIFSSIALIMVAGLATDASAQSRREIERDRERYERQQREYERQNRRQGRNRNRRQAENDITYFPGSRRQAMNANAQQGYDQGLIAGQYDARKKKYNNSNVYRNTGVYPNSGDPSAPDYAYRQGYLQGYEDGYHGRRNY